MSNLPPLPPDLLQLRRAAASAIVSAYRVVGAAVEVRVELQQPPPLRANQTPPCDPPASHSEAPSRDRAAAL